MSKNGCLTCVAVVIVVLFVCGCPHSAIPFEILEIHQGGRIIVNSIEKSRPISGVKWPGSSQTGLLADCVYYSIDTFDHLLLMTNVRTIETEMLVDFRKITEAKYRPWSVEFVNDTKIVVGAYIYDATRPLDRRHSNYLLQYDRRSGIIQRLPISIGSFPISLCEGRIYYEGEDGYIHYNDGSTDQSLGIIGKSPMVSPDGKSLAFFSHGKMMNSVHVYDFEKKEARAVKRFFSGLAPHIRWSADNRLLAVQTSNDLFLTPIYVLDASTGRTVHEFKKNSSHNWFFIENPEECVFNRSMN